jgi:predicted P-type ATPase
MLKLFLLALCYGPLLAAGTAVGIDDDYYYVDYSFSCPLQTDPTVGPCEQVCVNTTAACPAQLTCDAGLDLCADGSCQTACSDDLESPCGAYPGLGAACPAEGFEASAADCADTFSAEYAAMDAADGDDYYDDDYYGDLVEPDYAGFVFFYCWMAGLTFFSFLFFAYNNKIAPVGEVKDFLPEVSAHAYKETPADNAHCSQTGYRAAPLGRLLHAAVLLTLLGLQVVILLLTLAYYFILNRSDIKDDTPHLSLAWSPFDDAPQALEAFIIAWAIAFVWVVLFKRPDSLFAAFLRRSSLGDATHVAVFIPLARGVEVLNKTVTQTAWSQLFDRVFVGVDAGLAWLFSEPANPVPGTTENVVVQFDKTRFIDFHMRRYHFDEKTQTFLPAQLEVAGTAAAMLQKQAGLSGAAVAEREANIGPNIIEIADPSFIRIVFKEFSRIFYVYQNFMTWTWLNYAYWHMGIVNTIVYTMGGLTVSYVRYQSASRLKELSKVSGSVHVLRDGHFVEINQTGLVPGDVVSLRSGVAFCDMVILAGEAIVDESSLTGESMPVVKTALDPSNPVVYSALHHHKHHSIFAGTVVTNDNDTAVGEENRNLALVVRSGSHTMKGELLRDMLYGPPKKFKFDIEVNFVLLVLLCYAIFGFSMTIYFLESEPVYGFFYAIYVVASALPPLLPTVFIVSEGISADRLLKKRIAVSDSHRILMAGKVRVAFFDKTGTLTEQGLDFLSVITAPAAAAGAAPGAVFGESSAPCGLMARAMGVCHSVKKIKMGGEDTLIGNSLDRKMFEATGFALLPGPGEAPDVVVETDGGTETRWAVLRQFDFDSKRKTQTVIVRNVTDGGEDGEMWAFTKGTGEALKGMSTPASVPANLDAVLALSAKSGVYQISIGCRRVDAGALTQSRDAVERGVTFIGCINFSNRMKKETPGVLTQLREGDIRSVILSGDHVLTAIYIARLSGMVHPDSRLLLGKSVLPSGEVEWVEGPEDTPAKLPAPAAWAGSAVELAMSGPVWESLWAADPVNATRLAHFTRVVGRCSPSTKISFVDCFNRDGFITLMCGDGGNDCGALKTGIYVYI